MKKKKLILPLCLVLLAAAAVFDVYWMQSPGELRGEVLSYIESQSGLVVEEDYVTYGETGRVLEHRMGGWDARQLDLAGCVDRAESLRRVFSVPELEAPVLRLGERLSGGGGKLYYRPAHSMGAIEISLADDDGDWLDLYAAGFCSDYPHIGDAFREKMKQRVLKLFSPGDRDECLEDGCSVEIKTQEGLELLLRCIENSNVYNISGATVCSAGPPYVYLGGTLILDGGGDCNYWEPGTGRAAAFGFTEADAEALYGYIEAVLAGQTP